MENKTRHIRIEGRVQGVCFRSWTESEARRRGLSGWVRNRRDGSVEALFHGPSSFVEEMVTLCHKGPPAARVMAVEDLPVVAPPEDGRFRTLPTT